MSYQLFTGEITNIFLAMRAEFIPINAISKITKITKNTKIIHLLCPVFPKILRINRLF